MDDRHTRHMTHEKRFLPGHVLRRRLDHLIKNDSRWEGGSMVVHDDSVLAMISHATEERLKCLIEQMKSIVHERMLFSHNVKRFFFSFRSNRLRKKNFSFRMQTQVDKKSIVIVR